MTQPLGMSGEEKWWNLEPYRNPRKYEDYETGAEVIGYEYDFPAILKEQRRLVLEEVKKIVSSEQEKYPSHEISYQEDNYQAGGNHACFNILASLAILNHTDEVG